MAFWIFFGLSIGIFKIFFASCDIKEEGKYLGYSVLISFVLTLIICSVFNIGNDYDDGYDYN